MNFDLTEDQALALDAWERLLKRDIRPRVEPYRDSIIPKKIAHELLALTGEYGVGSGWVPESDGGLGLDFVTSGLLYEALAWVSPDLITYQTHLDAALRSARQRGQGEPWINAALSIRHGLIWYRPHSDFESGATARARTTRVLPVLESGDLQLPDVPHQHHEVPPERSRGPKGRRQRRAKHPSARRLGRGAVDRQ